MSAVLTSYLVMNRYNKYQTKQLQAYTYTCVHNSWWLVLGWVTTKEYHPRLCIDYVDFMVQLHLHTYVIRYIHHTTECISVRVKIDYSKALHEPIVIMFLSFCGPV